MLLSEIVDMSGMFLLHRCGRRERPLWLCRLSGLAVKYDCAIHGIIHRPQLAAEATALIQSGDAVQHPTLWEILVQ